MTNKKTIYISTGIVLLVALSVGTFLWLRPASSTNTTNTVDTPFGEGDGTSVSTSNNSETNTAPTLTGQSNTPVSGLQKISVAPISGATVFSQGSTTLVRYMDKATGNMYEFNATNNTTKRISNTTLPKISEVFWGYQQNTVFARAIKDGVLQTFVGSIATSSASSTESRLEGSYLSNNIFSFSVSPNKDKTFFLLPEQGGTTGYLADSKGLQAKTLWKFPSTEWIASWPKNDTIFLNTKASFMSEGYLYALNVKTGGMSPVLGHIQGLTTLVSPDGTYVLYSQSENNNISSHLLNTKTSQDTALAFTTLPEKCSWITVIKFICGVPSTTQNSPLPDSWYMGTTSFNDSLQALDVVVLPGENNNNIDGSFDLKAIAGLDIDVIHPQVSPDGTLLIFENKKDFSLWILPLSALR